tara:strand:- start:45 stop:227 length:183 start_codon:yes stop_codon:yes gene_type:complete
VEKKDPPIITRIKNKKDKLSELLFKETPILETLLVSDKNKLLKLLSKLKNNKNIPSKVLK